jgi:putative endonuclease
MTSDLPKRIYQHKEKLVEGFTEKHNLATLVYFEIFDSSLEAIKREKLMKKWNRTWKIELIENKNPDWNDLYDSIL